MSQTSTVPQIRTSISRESSLLLSPRKRRRIDNDEPGGEDCGHNQTTVAHPKSSNAEIFRWTLSRASVASCLVRDVFEMKVSGIRDMEYFWLGRIPCRTVHLVGLVVGVQVWEKRTVYTIDDGTAVVDCALVHAQVAPPRSVETKPQVSLRPKNESKASGPSYTDYLLSSRTTAPVTSTSSKQTTHKRPSTEPTPAPKPVVRIGQSVQVTGRVVSRHDSRIIIVDEISRCASYNDESAHISMVSELHRNTYYPPEPWSPFVPPPLPTQADRPTTLNRPASPSKPISVSEPVTPSSNGSTSRSTTISPCTTVAGSSPASSVAEERQVPRLRHPSRLHTRDLTANTFRIYVKHYMVNAPPPIPSRRTRRERSVSPSPTPRSSQTTRNILATPRPARPKKAVQETDATPRASRNLISRADRTPRATQLKQDFEDESDVDEDADVMYGFTLSHLRRVPELALLGRRVVKADAHRRAKEERKKAKSQTSQARAVSISSHQGADLRPSVAVKRLFKQAVRTLFSEGDIVLWSGPVRPLPPPTLDLLIPSSSASALWKAITSISSASTSTSASSSRSSCPSYEEWDEDEPLSDPAPNEEAYVPLIPAYFSRVLEGAIRDIMAETASKPAEAVRPSRMGTSLIERLRAQERESEAGTPLGPTKEQLLAWLRNSDERWARVGEWTVSEALEWGRREGRLWCVGNGRWELCG